MLLHLDPMRHKSDGDLMETFKYVNGIYVHVLIVIFSKQPRLFIDLLYSRQGFEIDWKQWRFDSKFIHIKAGLMHIQ